MKYAIYKDNEKQHVVGNRQAALIVLEDIKRKAIDAKDKVSFHNDNQAMYLWVGNPERSKFITYTAKPQP